MKPLIRQTLYDILKRSLYKYEIRTKVWNNPYFPFDNAKEADDFLHNLIVNDANKEKLKQTIERIKAHPDYTKQTRESYAEFIDNQRKSLITNNTTDIMNNYYDFALRYLSQDFVIWDMLEYRYGKRNF